MKSLITKTLISVFILFIILSFFILNIENKENKNTAYLSEEELEKNQKNKTYLYIYDVIVILFILLFIFFIFYNGLYKGTINSLFIWAFFVLCTPVPEAGLLISLPVKRYFNIRMDICQTFVSLLALFMIFYFYYTDKKVINTSFIGKLFNGLVKYNY